MGRRELGIKKLKLSRFDLGYFPNKDFDDVPDGGTPSCKHVFHRRSALRPFPGMERINTTIADYLTGQGLHYLDVRNGTRRLAVFGSRLYSFEGGDLTNITGTASITDGNLVQFIDHQQGSNQYSIGASGGTPFRIGATGTGTALGGSPPSFSTISKYHDTVFGSVNELNYFSDTGDPETWDTTNWVIPFEKNITCQFDHGQKNAVMMESHIGSIQGYDYLDFFAEEKEITAFGCVGKMAAKKCNWGANDLKVIATIARNGVWVFDESFGFNKVLGDDYFDEFNQSYLTNSSMAFWKDENLLFLALPYAAATQPNYLIIVNTKTGAFWPGPDIHSNYIKSLSSMRDLDGNEFIYFQDNNGYVYRFNMDANYYHTGTATQEIDHEWKSKRYDLEDVHSLGDVVMLAEAVGNWGINVGINFGLEDSVNIGTINFSADNDVLTYSFVLGASILRGNQYIFKTLLGIGGFGRFVQVILTKSGVPANTTLSETFVLGESELGYGRSYRAKLIELSLHRHREGGDDK